MKDYYKILGVKRNASEEEIREHWVKLVRKLHPDQRMEGAVEDERIKEINEAYDTLKYPSTRVKYDLKMAYDREKRRFPIQRMILPAGILIILLVISLFIFKRSQIAIKPNEMEKVQETKPATILPPLTFPSVAKGESKSNEKHFKSLKSEMPVKVKKVVPKEINEVGVQESARIVPEEVPKVEETRSAIQEQEPSVVPTLTVVQSEAPVDSSSLAAAGEQIEVKTEPIDLIGDIDKKGQINETAASPPIKVELQTAEFKSPPLIATEEDVRKFFANYTKRYTQKDLDGFLSLFSPRAVQNRKDGLEMIRKIYAKFFNQSQEIEYHMKDMRIEIYQNGVEVKARYELVQVLKKGGGKKIWRGDIRWTLVKEDGGLKILSLDYQPQKSP
jgi:hypothetical protein